MRFLPESDVEPSAAEAECGSLLLFVPVGEIDLTKLRLELVQCSVLFCFYLCLVRHLLPSF